MKAFKLELYVVDYEGLGLDVFLQNLDYMRYYSPVILDAVEADIGDWSDDHPLNSRKTTKEQKLSYFTGDNPYKCDGNPFS